MVRKGLGTALKPAHEPICVARKPLAKGHTVAANVLAHGTGALNIDGCRVGTDDRPSGGTVSRPSVFGPNGGAMGAGADTRSVTPDAGRWPANLIHDGSVEVVALFPDSTSGARAAGVRQSLGSDRTFTPTIIGDGGPAIEASTGSAARFFYCAKASKSDRDGGLDGFAEKPTAFGNQAQAELKRGNLSHSAGNSGMNKVKMRANTHPTVKPTDLMAYLCRLVTPPGGVVLDPFMGSGSTGKAAMREGFQFIGIDLSEEYFPIAQARIEHELAAVTEANAPPPPAPQMDMFAAI